MKISGFEKLTLIDYPEKLACTLFLHGCNFRCGFCHNPELVLTETESESSKADSREFSQKDILDFLEKRKNLLDGVCITGGEPLMTIDLRFLKQIKSLGYSIKIDTNGSFPEKLKELIENNLVDYVAMDVKASKEKYDIINAPVDFEKIERSMKLVSGLENYEFRTTIIGGIHLPEEIKKIVGWINNVVGKKPKKFCMQGFKNKGKLIENLYKMKKDVQEDYLLELKELVKDYFEVVEVRV